MRIKPILIILALLLAFAPAIPAHAEDQLQKADPGALGEVKPEFSELSKETLARACELMWNRIKLLRVENERLSDQIRKNQGLPPQPTIAEGDPSAANKPGETNEERRRRQTIADIEKTLTYGDTLEQANKVMRSKGVEIEAGRYRWTDVQSFKLDENETAMPDGYWNYEARFENGRIVDWSRDQIVKE